MKQGNFDSTYSQLAGQLQRLSMQGEKLKSEIANIGTTEFGQQAEQVFNYFKRVPRNQLPKKKLDVEQFLLKAQPLQPTKKIQLAQPSTEKKTYRTTVLEAEVRLVQQVSFSNRKMQKPKERLQQKPQSELQKMKEELRQASQLLRTKKAATMIQKHWRAYFVRQYFTGLFGKKKKLIQPKKPFVDREEGDEGKPKRLIKSRLVLLQFLNFCATKIQARFRGYLQRKLYSRTVRKMKTFAAQLGAAFRRYKVRSRLQSTKARAMISEIRVFKRSLPALGSERVRSRVINDIASKVDQLIKLIEH